MKPRQNSLFWTVCGIHVGIIFLLIVIPLIRGCFRPKPVDVSVSVAIVEAPPQPQAVPSQTDQKPAMPEPEPEPQKPKWKPAEVVRQNNRVSRQTSTPTPAPQQTPDLSTVKKALAGTVDLFSSYYQSVFARYYAVWQQPATAPFGTQAVALITVEPDGRISMRRLSQPSGVAAFDQSVQAALQRVNSLPAPPTDLPSRTISVTFVLSN